MYAFNHVSVLWQSLLNTVLALMGWCCIAPVALLIPRRKNVVLVWGREGGKFLDNAKYFFLQAQQQLPQGTKCIFATEHPSVLNLLQTHQLPVVLYPTWSGVWLLLSAHTIVVDSVDWHLKIRRFLLCGAKKVQLWHGVGFKRIEDDKLLHEVSAKTWAQSRVIYAMRKIMRKLTGRQVRYDLVNTTSQFYLEEVFKPAISSRHFITAGYPRNSFTQPLTSLFTLNSDGQLLQAAQAWGAQQRKIVLVAPTFRDSRASPLGLTPATQNMLNAWCAANAVEVIFKFHPLERGHSQIQAPHLHIIDSGADIYPFMPLAHALVTDYSSIYMDFLLLQKPILFFVPDLEEYIRRDRQLQFDYDSMTPGPKLLTWADLLVALEAQWKTDEYHLQRSVLVAKAFDGHPQADATSKLLAFMTQHEWVG